MNGSAWRKLSRTKFTAIQSAVTRRNITFRMILALWSEFKSLHAFCISHLQAIMPRQPPEAL